MVDESLQACSSMEERRSDIGSLLHEHERMV